MQRRSGARRGVRAAALVLLLCCCVRPSLQQEPAAAAPAEPAAPAAAAGAGGGAPAAGKSKVVELAPEVDVEHGDDIDPAGACAAFISSSSCKDVDAGEGQLAECISDLISEAEGEQESGSPAEAVPDACQGAVYDYYIKRSKNINANLPLAKACKEDALRHCNKTWFFGAGEGQIIACLIETKDAVSPDCRGQVFKAQRAAAADYRADPLLAEFCAGDAERLCPDVKPGGGRKQACLRDKHLQVSWECAEQLFQQDLASGDDLRLSVRLYRSCLPDKKRFCAEIDAGHAEARDCLVEHKEDEGFSSKCRDELDAMLQRRVRDFRLDSRLRKHCHDDIARLCGALGELGGDEAEVQICLQDYATDIRDERCFWLVKQYQALAAQDIRFDVQLAEACHDDRGRLCGAVPPGSARVTRCLESHRDALSPLCRATLFDEELRFSENIDFQYPMKRACAKEMATYCGNVPHGNARVIRCLQENKGRKDFGQPCLTEVTQYEQTASSDYRLNYRLRVNCKDDVAALCAASCPLEDRLCGGAVLRCLTDNQGRLRSAACRGEVLYFERMEVRDYRNDVILAAACRGDVEALCGDVQPGVNGSVHACLRDNRAKLSDACRREELLLESVEAEHIELRGNLLAACDRERGLFCKGVEAGGARVFRCLADNLADPDFGNTCRQEIITKLQRRQANWKLDPPLRRACRSDVSRLCKAEDAAASETGLVYKCLVSHADDLEGECRKELGRAVHMALFVWIPGSILTQPCDVDVADLCLASRPNMLHQPGEVAECLADALERIVAAEAPSWSASPPPGAPAPPRMSAPCRALADAAEPPSVESAFEASLSYSLFGGRLSALEAKTGVPLVSRDQTGHAEAITLSGWSALAGILALVATVTAGAAYGWRRWYGGPGDKSTVVLKSRGAYRRVGAGGLGE